ncbi:phosphoenolpyruvate synthase [Spirosoma knui]
MGAYVFSIQHVDKTKLALVGGKGANLGEISRIEGIQVPDGFCVSTEAFARIVAETPLISDLIDRLSLLAVKDRAKIGELSKALRTAIEDVTFPRDIAEEIAGYLATFGENKAYAVRSSATAEDSPTASFAGQYDTYLHVIGLDSILIHIRKCWASLFTERAIMYRLQTAASADRFDHRNVRLAVVVQQMVFARVAGILFTADPVTSNRKIVSIDASFGLGEALVSGLVNADTYKVREGKIIDKQIAAKKLAIYAAEEGGTSQQEIAPEQQNQQALTDEQILRLERIGRTIETHFGYPQDIEWCLADDTVYVVQSRPITTLYPIPEADGGENAGDSPHVYVSVGHQQMMTDAMKPLGLSLWQLTAARPMYKAGGRLFVDVTDDLASPARRGVIINVLGKSDPLTRDALTTVLGRDEFINVVSDTQQEQNSGKPAQGPTFADYQTLKDYDPSIVADLIRRSELAIKELKQAIQLKSGVALIDFMLDDMQQSRRSLAHPESFGVLMTAMNAASWINENIEMWLGEKNVADLLSQSVPNNVTSEMGLALLDVADVIRPYPEVVAYLQQVALSPVTNAHFWSGLVQCKGGQEARNALEDFLNKYGMRCAGEIDMTRTRWREKPTILVPTILTHIKHFEPGESKRKFEQGRQQALKKEQELLGRLKDLPDGEQKVEAASRMISLVRNLAGYREYPKYEIVSRYFVYKQALLNEAERLVQAAVIQDREDLYYLTFQELRDVVRTHTLDHKLIARRKEEYKSYEKLTPPRVITSNGEIITGAYNRENLPTDAMAGIAVSSGVVEGRARVIVNMEEADLEEGDILVTSFTDPSWTPLFVSIKGLVTEVGGRMTHGAVIAREYGLPAVVGVENATKLIKDRQRIRVHGTEGFVEIL